MNGRQTANTIMRTNWGVVFHKIGSLLNSCTQYRHTFAVTIPHMTPVVMDLMSCSTAKSRHLHCEEINIIIANINDHYTTRFQKTQTELDTLMLDLGDVDSIENTPHHDHSSMNEPLHCSQNADSYYNRTAYLRGAFGDQIHSSLLMKAPFDGIGMMHQDICHLSSSNVGLDSSQMRIVESTKRNLSSSSGTSLNYDWSHQFALISLKKSMNATLNRYKTNAPRSIDDEDEDSDVATLEYTQGFMLTILSLLERFQNAARLQEEGANRFMRGIHTLTEGYMSPYLVPREDVRSVLLHVTSAVLPRYNRLAVVRPHGEGTRFYYDIKSVVYTRTGKHVLVNMEIPLKYDDEGGGIMTAYRVQRLHVPTAQQHESSTKIGRGLANIIAVSQDMAFYTEMTSSQFMGCKGQRSIKVCEIESGLMRRSASSFPRTKSCTGALFYDEDTEEDEEKTSKIREVTQFCEILFEPEDTDTKVMRLGQSTEADPAYVYHVHANRHTSGLLAPSDVWNHDDEDKVWLLECPYSSTSHEEHKQNETTHPSRAVSMCNTCLIKMPCGCSLDGGDFFIPPMMTGCVPGKNVIKSFPLNLAVFSSFFNNSLKDGDPIMYHNISKIGTQDESDRLFPHDPLALMNFTFNLTSLNRSDIVSNKQLYMIDFKALMRETFLGTSPLYINECQYAINSFNDLYTYALWSLQQLHDQYGGSLYKLFLNPVSTTSNICLFWIVAALSIIMSVYNLAVRI